LDLVLHDIGREHGTYNLVRQKFEYTISTTTTLTSNGVGDLDDIEVLAANRAAIGPFHPRFQAIVMEDMETR
jgi:hypothetical protein